MKAWLITWEWCGRNAAVADKAAAILPPQYSDGRVADIVQLLYNLATLELSEWVAYAKRPGQIAYKPRVGMVINSVPHGERIICGHNPWLYGRRVIELCVRQEPETGFEVIEWTEPQTFRWKDERQMGFEVAAQGLRKEVRRSMQGPLHSGLVWDRLLNAPKPGYESCDLGL
jgi:uncharacterized NAD(P)/FAD-binding protein YdhS